jgi:hypothetical protein
MTCKIFPGDECEACAAGGCCCEAYEKETGICFQNGKPCNYCKDFVEEDDDDNAVD